MSTSAGRCFSKAAISGALQLVWPPTMARVLVAVASLRSAVMYKNGPTLTSTVLSDDGFYVLSLDIVHNPITAAGNKMTIRKYRNVFLITTIQSFGWCGYVHDGSHLHDSQTLPSMLHICLAGHRH